METVKNGDSVLVIWDKSDQNNISNFVNQLQGACGNGSVVLENSQMLTESSRPHSSFNVIISNWLAPHPIHHTDSLFSIIIKLLKPSGKVVIKDNTDLTSSLKINGFTNIVCKDGVLTAEKPNFEVGSKAPLKLGNKSSVWKLDDTVEEAWTAGNDDEIINSDDLLDEADTQKPDQASLRVCSTTGKRKACADCSCGLAEELAGEVKQTPKSSCGSDMAPTVDYATIIILDIGENTFTSEKHEKSFFEQAKQCALRIIERNIMIQTKNLVGIVLLGAGKTKNALAEQCRGAFKSIAMTYELQAPTWQMIRDLPETTTNRRGDWFEGLIVAAHHFKDGISGVKINSKKIVLITNFESPAKVGKNFDEVVNGFQEEGFEVYVIGPDLETQDSKDIQLVKQFITSTNGDTATFDEAMRGWLFHKKKASKLTPQNFDLSFGPKIKIPISAYIRVRDEPVVKNWQKSIKDPVSLKEDTIEAYKYGQKIIPFSESDKKTLYQSGERSLSLYGFTDKSNINWQNLHGDGTYYVFGRKGDKRAQYAIECLISSLLELNLVGVVRKVHSKASEPNMFALMPVIEPNSYICLSLINLCYKDEIKNMAFPPTDLKKFTCSTEQVNAFKELITAMDLTKAYKDDEYCETEAFPVAETVSPSIQYILDCISFRAMNPGKPLPQPREEIMTMFKVPTLIEKRARDPIEKLTKLFTLHKIEVKSRKKALAIPDDAVTDAEMAQIKVDEDMPKVQMPLKDATCKIKSISTVNPVTDFEVLKNKGKTLAELVPEMTEVIETVVYTSFGGDFSKALESMKILRDECVAHDPSHYNNWLKKFKRDLTERKREGFLNMIAEKKLDFILNSENGLSAVTEENSHDDSQMYENDTVPNTAELSIATDINDMFDEM